MSPDEHEYINADGKAFNGNYAPVMLAVGVIALAAVAGIWSLLTFIF